MFRASNHFRPRFLKCRATGSEADLTSVQSIPKKHLFAEREAERTLAAADRQVARRKYTSPSMPCSCMSISAGSFDYDHSHFLGAAATSAAGRRVSAHACAILHVSALQGIAWHSRLATLAASTHAHHSSSAALLRKIVSFFVIGEVFGDPLAIVPILALVFVNGSSAGPISGSRIRCCGLHI